tara:strand:+ start:95 stop:718 length:624 start_codon:yes stop_codon:yes gene_type:complete
MEFTNNLSNKIIARNEIINSMIKENKELLEKNIKYHLSIRYFEDKINHFEKNYKILSKQYSKLILDYQDEVEYIKVLDKANNKLLDSIDKRDLDNNKLEDENNSLVNKNEKLLNNINELKIENNNLNTDIKLLKEEKEYYQNKCSTFKSSLECNICASDKISVILNPCGHVCCCVNCVKRIESDNNLKKCPICNSKFKDWKKIYLPI